MEQVEEAIISSCPRDQASRQTRISVVSRKTRCLTPQSPQPTHQTWPLRAGNSAFNSSQCSSSVLIPLDKSRGECAPSSCSAPATSVAAGPILLAFTAPSSKADQAAIADVLAAHGRDGFAAAWLRRKGLDGAAELLEPAAPPDAATLSEEPAPP